MAFNYYEPSTLRGVIKNSIPLRLFFRDRFFSNHILFPTEQVSFEFSSAHRRLAPYVNPRIGSESISRDGYEVRDYRPPLVAPERVITNDTLMQKLLGEAPFNSGLSPEDRAAQIIAQDVIELQDAIWRREEYMCARVKQDGKLYIKGNGVNAIVDYGFKNVKSIDKTEKWDENFDILGQLNEYSDELLKAGFNADMLLLGRDAAKALLTNKKLIKLLDARRIELGEIRPVSLENGVKYLGHIATYGVDFDVYTYTEFYPDENGDLKSIIDPETCLIMSSTEQNSMLYGSVTLLDKNGDYMNYMEEYVPNTWFTQKPPQRFMSISSRPLPMPHNLDSWFVLKNVVNGTD